MKKEFESLKRILKDGGCDGFDCPECALYVRGLGCELEKHITRKTGTVEQFSLTEMDYVKKKMGERDANN